MEIDECDISRYGVVVPNDAGTGIAGLVENPMQAMRHQTSHPSEDTF